VPASALEIHQGIATAVSAGPSTSPTHPPAMLANLPFRHKWPVRLGLLLPWALPLVFAGLIFRWFFEYQQGLVNDLLTRFGVEPVAWLTEPKLAVAAICIAILWKTSSFMALMLLAGLQTIPKSLYEAAEVDPGLARAGLAVAVEVVVGVGMSISMSRGGPIASYIVQRCETALSCFPPWAFVLAMIAIGRPEHSPTLPSGATAALVGFVFSPRIARIPAMVSMGGRAKNGVLTPITPRTRLGCMRGMFQTTSPPQSRPAKTALSSPSASSSPTRSPVKWTMS